MMGNNEQGLPVLWITCIEISPFVTSAGKMSQNEQIKKKKMLSLFHFLTC